MLNVEEIFYEGEEDEDFSQVEFIDGPCRSIICTSNCTAKSVCHI